MADYRRLISYIYEYEGKQKGKKCGIREAGGAERASAGSNVNVKRIYMGGNCYRRVPFRDRRS